MNRQVYPCLWFDQNARQAAHFYCTVFKNGKILEENPVVISYSIAGTKFMNINGGPGYKVNPAVSYYVYCGSEAEINRIYYALTANGGSVLMPLNSYPWTEKYAWITDQYGVNWQLDVHDINNRQKIVPSLLFANQNRALVKHALTHYTHIFEPANILMETPYPNPQEADMEAGTLLFAQFQLNDCIFNAMSSHIPHPFNFTPANSFVVTCQNQQQIDHCWATLGQDGRYDMCGWLADKFGVSWQIVPDILPKLMQDPQKAPKVTQALLKMKKLDIETLLNA